VRLDLFTILQVSLNCNMRNRALQVVVRTRALQVIDVRANASLTLVHRCNRSPVLGVNGISGRLTGFSIDYFEQDAVDVNSNCLCSLGCNKYLLAVNTADAVHVLEVHIVADCDSNCGSSGGSNGDDNTTAAAAAGAAAIANSSVAQRSDDVSDSNAAAASTTASAASSLSEHAIMTLQCTADDTTAAVWPASAIVPEALVTAESSSSSDAPGYSAVLSQQRCLDIEALISAVLAEEQSRAGSAQDVQHSSFVLVDYNVRVLTAGISGATDSRRTGKLRNTPDVSLLCDARSVRCVLHAVVVSAQVHVK
jgi:hypothetical protein